MFEEEEIEYISELLEDASFEEKLRNDEPLSSSEKELLLNVTRQEMSSIIQAKLDGRYDVGYGNYESDVYVISKIIVKIMMI